MSRRMRIVFTLSLLVNIVFIGLAGGVLYRFQGQLPPLPERMSPEARQFITQTYQEGREQIRPLIEEVKAKRGKVESVITADEFDPKAYQDSVNDMMETRAAISRKKAEIMGKALADLPAEDRQEFSKRILESLEGRRPYKGGYHRKMMEKDCLQDKDQPVQNP
jgi:uncharacterized membrane protein